MLYKNAHHKLWFISTACNFMCLHLREYPQGWVKVKTELVQVQVKLSRQCTFWIYFSIITSSFNSSLLGKQWMVMNVTVVTCTVLKSPWGDKTSVKQIKEYKRTCLKMNKRVKTRKEFFKLFELSTRKSFGTEGSRPHEVARPLC